jgi:hypothetical protein
MLHFTPAELCTNENQNKNVKKLPLSKGNVKEQGNIRFYDRKQNTKR